MITDRLSAQSMLVSAVGAHVCLGFANTLSWRGSKAPVETLTDFAALVTWAEASAGWPAHAARALEGWGREHPLQAATLLAEAIALREAIYRIFSASARGDGVCNQDFAALSRALSQAPVRQRLARSDAGCAWQIELGQIGRAGLAAAVLLAPALWSAADLLVGGGQQRIRRCANDACLWLFLDESKNGTRRWCDMASCGNRAKARRHYLKTKRD
jgi:predicted RNA-binding Zn ribbon-like protein